MKIRLIRQIRVPKKLSKAKTTISKKTEQSDKILFQKTRAKPEIQANPLKPYIRVPKKPSKATKSFSKKPSKARKKKIKSKNLTTFAKKTVFFFKKNKPTLQEVIPQDYIDIHSHILPGIDDGAKNTADTTYLLEKMKSFGFSEIIGTPHIIQGIWENTYHSIQKTFEDNQEVWNESGLKIAAAAEYMMDSEFEKLFKTEKLRTLKDNYVLVEMSYINPPIQLYKILFDLQVAGYQAVLAHPERYVFYHKSLDEYKKLINAGCKLQLNLLSLTGYYGSEVAKVADYLLKNGMYSFSGSDIHHQNHIKSFGNKILISEAKLVTDLLEKNSFFKK